VAYKDGGTFKTYCDKPYDRHTYKIVFKDGQSVSLNSYDDVQRHWHHFQSHAHHIEVIDVRGTGF